MSEPAAAPDFLRARIADDVRAGRFEGRVHTRFPPEPNGYLHVGHAKSICLNFGLAADFGGKCNLRFDDTNPETEEVEYVDSIQQDIRWLGFDWDGPVRYASDYYDQIHDYAVQLIRAGKAYVDSLSADEIREHRGSPTAPGRDSPYRDRSIAENLDLFARMRAGEFADGTHVLRAKIDMAHPNINLRDPTMYRIRRAHHYRTGDRWCIYPMYDWAHGLCDSIERITHSICTLEFEHHRPLYDWFLEALGIYHPQQIEFARLNLDHTVMSKRRLLQLVERRLVAGWDDPRLPTLSGMRRRGYTPEAIRAFCAHIGVTKFNAVHEYALLENFLRDDLNRRSERRMAVLRPLKLVVENWPAGQRAEFAAVNNPEDPAAGTRQVPFGRELWIERDDWRDEPPKDWHRLAPGREVRLRYACIVRCTDVVRDPQSGAPAEIRCTYDPESLAGRPGSARRVKGTIHWVAAATAVPAEVRLYDRLLNVPEIGDLPEGEDWTGYLNPDSLEVLRTAVVEPELGRAGPGSRWQFERLGYFCADSADTKPGAPVFNRTVTLRDTWSRIEKRSSS
jgi:glutaminyl-tRNA synthetase